MFEAVERQSFFIYATLVASVLDVSVAIALIPQHGALGAAIGSGSAQMLCVGTLWALAIRRYHVQLPWRFLGKVVAVSVVAALAAFVIVRRTSPVVGLLLGSTAAAIIFLVLADLARIFEPEDLARFRVLVEACPAALAAPVNMTFSWLSRRTVPATTEELL